MGKKSQNRHTAEYNRSRVASLNRIDESINERNERKKLARVRINKRSDYNKTIPLPTHNKPQKLGKYRDFVKELKRNTTPYELKLKARFDRDNVIYTFQKKIEVNSTKFYIADFCVNKLLIELDGIQHYTLEGQIKDAERTKLLKGLGYRVIRFKNSAIKKEFEKTIKSIYTHPKFKKV